MASLFHPSQVELVSHRDTKDTKKLRMNCYSPAVNGLATDEHGLTQMIPLKRNMFHTEAQRAREG